MSEKDKKEKPEKKDKEEREREKEREKEEKEREKEREKQRERALYIERQNEKLYRREKKEDDKKREKELEKERERDKEREKEQEKEKHKLEKKEKKEHEKEQKEKDKEHKDKDKEQKEKDKEKDKEHKEKDKEKKEKDKEKDKEQKEKDKQKQKEKKEKDKEKDKKKDKNKQKDKNEKGDKALAAQAKQLETANGNDDEKANETKVTVIDPSKFDRLPESVVAGLVNITESDHLGPALKSIFESGKERETIDNLNSYVQRKQGEIEEICSENYQEFINSVNELLEVRQDTRQMREAIISINKDTQSDAAFVLERAQALSAKRKERQRIEAAIMATRGLQHVISVCMQIDEYIKANSFYPALRLLDQVQRVYLRKGLAGDGPLFRVLEAHVPKLRTKIKKQVTEEFNDWLVLVRQKCEEVGSLAMHQMEGQIEREHAMNPLKRTEHGWDIQEVDRKVQPPLDFQQGEVEQPLFEKVEIDFLPLYRCIHIHEYLGAKPEFATYYKENRRLQALLVLKERVTEVTEPYFHQIAGFFIVENTVLETSTLVPRAVVESLWDYAVAKMKAVLQEQFAYVQSPEVLKKIKSFVFCFASTLRSYSYDVSSLTGFLDTLKEKYTELSVAKFVEDFQHMVEEDKLEPLKVTTLDEHERLIKANRLDVPLDQREEEPVNNNLANSSGLGPPSTPLVGSSSRRRLTDEELPSLPQDYWFSIIVPQFYDHVRKFIMEFYEFASDLSDTDQYIIKSTDNLIKSLSQILVTTIDQANNVPQLVQTITNTLYILKSVNFFGDFLGRWTRAGGRVTLLSARKQLENAIASGEKRIVELGDQKLDELMTTAANITWLPVSASTMPRDYIQDIILYLNTTLAFTEQLSSQLKEEIATRAFKRVGDAMLGMLLGTQGVPFKKFNIAAIKSLDVDLVEIETFAREKTTLLKTSKNLAIYFGELRQIVSLLLSDNMEEFLDPKIRSKNYPLISNLPQLVSLLQKFKEESQGFFSAKDPKMVQINILIKKLKELN